MQSRPKDRAETGRPLWVRWRPRRHPSYSGSELTFLIIIATAIGSAGSDRPTRSATDRGPHLHCLPRVETLSSEGCRATALIVGSQPSFALIMAVILNCQKPDPNCVAASVLDRVILVPLVLVPVAIAGIFPHFLLAFAVLDPTLGIGAWLLLSRSDGPRFHSSAGTP